MTDQTNAQGHDQHGAQADAGPPLSAPSEPTLRPEHEMGQTPAEPVGEQQTPLHAEQDSAKDTDRAEPFETADEPGSGAARTIDAEPAKRKSSILLPIAALVGVALIGGGGYVSWLQYEASQGQGPGIFEPAQPEAQASNKPGTDAGNPETAKSVETKVDTAKTEAAPVERAASDVKANEAAPAAGKVPEAPAGAAVAESDAKEEAAKSAPAPVVGNPSPAERDLNDRLAQTQAQLNLMQKRLAADEAKLAEPRGEAEPARASDAAARLVLAQSVATALRQDADASSLIGALEKLGADPQNVAQLRAGLSAPSLPKLASDFSGLSDRIIAAASPPASQNTAEPAPKSLGDKALAFLRSRAEKLVKVRAIGSLQDQAAGHVAKAIKDLNAGDLAGALAEQAQLPEPARAVSADWAKAAKARLDAEQAAKAEVEAALQNLSKSKS